MDNTDDTVDVDRLPVRRGEVSHDLGDVADRLVAQARAEG